MQASCSDNGESLADLHPDNYTVHLGVRKVTLVTAWRTGGRRQRERVTH